jgi:hypothetical protein
MEFDPLSGKLLLSRIFTASGTEYHAHFLEVLYDTVKRCELDLEYDMGISEVRLSDAIKWDSFTL